MEARRKKASDQAPWKPTREQLAQAGSKRVPDLIAPGLRVLFCGINPGLYSGAVERHFARPGNRFWPTLYAAGFTERLLSPFEEDELLRAGMGITNIAQRTTATAAELSPEELVAGGRRLRRMVKRFAPKFLAVLGVTAYRTAFDRPKAKLGRQEEMWGSTAIWVLPSPSGLNAHYQRADLAKVFAELRVASEE